MKLLNKIMLSAALCTACGHPRQIQESRRNARP